MKSSPKLQQCTRGGKEKKKSDLASRQQATLSHSFSSFWVRLTHCGVCPPFRYRVVVSYPPQSEAEIELKEGDIVFVHKKREDGWYKGTLQRNGRTGLFPGSFVESF